MIKMLVIVDPQGMYNDLLNAPMGSSVICGNPFGQSIISIKEQYGWVAASEPHPIIAIETIMQQATNEAYGGKQSFIMTPYTT